MSEQDKLKKLFNGVMGETVHAAFRKGSEHPSAHKVWKAIQSMPRKEWGNVVEWISWALAYSLESELKVVSKSEPSK